MADAVPAREATSRRRHRLDVAAGLAFVVGGSLFALGAALAQQGSVALVVVNVTYLVGGCFFTLGGVLSVMAAGGHGPDRAWRGAVVLLVGTLLFGVSLVAAFAEGLTPRQSDGWIWLPDISGCVCFLVSGHLALLDVREPGQLVPDRTPDWWVATVNQAGSILFFLAGLAAFTRPATDEVVNEGLVNGGTFAGAACFVAAGFLQSSIPTRTVGPAT
ncbi:hypothetical protein [Aeromicrobium massiliense]|uniref:hypothetical protein n=1 Tax=Aeromicrobium massiliense TaxID=1464554 RepID=UPI000315BA97|nr:hypothetical protein [Aeromicrobium massiliense]